MVPDGEGAVIAQGEHQVLAVVGRFREGEALAHGNCIDDGLDILADGSRLRVETDFQEVVLRLRELARNLDLPGGGEIERPAVGRKGREALPDALLLDLGRRDNLVVHHVVHLQVRIQVEHFDDLVRLDMEALAGIVGGVGDVLAGRMPVGIDAESERGVGLRVVGGHFTVHLQQRGAVVAADVEAEGIRIAAVVGVAVHAAVELGVLQQAPFLEGSKLPFVNAHVAVNLIAGGDQAVVEAVVDRVRRDEDPERVERFPSAVDAAGHLHAEGVADAPFQQRLPFPDGQLGEGFPPVLENRPVRSGDTDFQPVCAREGEVQGGDAGGDGHTRVIGVNGRPAACRGGVAHP